MASFPRPILTEAASLEKLGHASSLILERRVGATSYDAAARLIVGWAEAGETRKVAAANVHMLIAAYDDPAFGSTLDGFDLVTPDGMPLVWRLRSLGHTNQGRVYGPDLMLAICALAERHGVPIGLFGGTPEALDGTCIALARRFPALRVTYAVSPPMRTAAHLEDEAVLASIRESGARILFVALGCPKQERWIALNAPQLPMVLFAVGAAIDFISGRIAQAPAWAQRAGLEWLFRLLADPKRLLSRYFHTNTRLLLLWALGKF